MLKISIIFRNANVIDNIDLYTCFQYGLGTFLDTIWDEMCDPKEFVPDQSLEVFSLDH